MGHPVYIYIYIHIYIYIYIYIYVCININYVVSILVYDIKSNLIYNVPTVEIAQASF